MSAIFSVLLPYGTHETSLRNHFLVCRHAEKTLQAIRLLKREVSANKACRFIMYFATGAEVDYFYRVSEFSRVAPSR